MGSGFGGFGIVRGFDRFARAAEFDANLDDFTDEFFFVVPAFFEGHETVAFGLQFNRRFPP